MLAMAHLLVIENWVGLSAGTGPVLPVRLLEQGHRYTFVSRRPELYARGLRPGRKHPVLEGAQRAVVAETHRVDLLVPALAEIHAQDPFDGVLSGCDYYLETVARVAQALQLPGNDPAAIKRCLHKHETRQTLAKAGLDSPAFQTTARWSEAQGFFHQHGRVVVKAPDLGGGELVRLVEDEGALREAFDAVLASAENSRGQPRVPLVLLEELLEGDEFSVETFTYEGRTGVVGCTDKTVSGRPCFIETAHMFPARLSVEERTAVEESARSAIQALGLRFGVAHTEVKLTPRGPRVVEVNPRMAGGEIYRLVERVTGIDLFRVTVDLALGRPPQGGQQTSKSPPKGSAALFYLLPPGGGRIVAVEGLESLRASPAVTHVQVQDVVGRTVRTPTNNDDVIGHFIIEDATGPGARALGEGLLKNISFRMEEAGL